MFAIFMIIAAFTFGVATENYVQVDKPACVQYMAGGTFKTCPVDMIEDAK